MCLYVLINFGFTCINVLVIHFFIYYVFILIYIFFYFTYLFSYSHVSFLFFCSSPFPPFFPFFPFFSHFSLSDLWTYRSFSLGLFLHFYIFSSLFFLLFFFLHFFQTFTSFTTLALFFFDPYLYTFWCWDFCWFSCLSSFSFLFLDKWITRSCLLNMWNTQDVNILYKTSLDLSSNIPVNLRT